MGDALAVALMKARAFTSMDFARLHPGGSLGRRLLMTVGNVMRKNDLPVALQVPTTVNCLFFFTYCSLIMATIGSSSTISTRYISTLFQTRKLKSEQ